MKKYLSLILLSLVVVRCGTFPTASDYWTIDGVWPGYEKVQNDMLSCGFTNTWNPTDMPRNEKLKAHLCMEKKGYLFNDKPVCKWSFYNDLPACKQ